MAGTFASVVGQLITFEATIVGSVGPYTGSLDYGDGVVDTFTAGTPGVSGATVTLTHTYTAQNPSGYTVTITIQDPFGFSDSDFVTMRIFPGLAVTLTVV